MKNLAVPGSELGFLCRKGALLTSPQGPDSHLARCLAPFCVQGQHRTRAQNGSSSSPPSQTESGQERSAAQLRRSGRVCGVPWRSRPAWTRAGTMRAGRWAEGRAPALHTGTPYTRVKAWARESSEEVELVRRGERTGFWKGRPVGRRGQGAPEGGCQRGERPQGRGMPRATRAPALLSPCQKWEGCLPLCGLRRGLSASFHVALRRVCLWCLPCEGQGAAMQRRWGGGDSGMRQEASKHLGLAGVGAGRAPQPVSTGE